MVKSKKPQTDHSINSKQQTDPVVMEAVNLIAALKDAFVQGS